MQRRFVIEALLFLLVAGAVLFYRHTQTQQELQFNLQASRKRYLENEPRPDRKLSTSEAMANSDRRGASIHRPGNAFQREDFASAVLDDATLQAGVASFQMACFDKASLRNAKLTGGASSFQAATFVGADLTATRLNGNFQLASFENAVLTRAAWSGSFQQCNISGARFAGADLSAIDKSDLETCYFVVPPTYSPQTKFPAGFHPISQGWRQAPSDL